MRFENIDNTNIRTVGEWQTPQIVSPWRSMKRESLPLGPVGSGRVFFFGVRGRGEGTVWGRKMWKSQLCRGCGSD